MKTKIKPCPISGHLLGDDRVETHYIAADGNPHKRVDIKIEFDKPQACRGETVTVLGVPADSFLMVNNEITDQRSFVMRRESVRVSLVGKYRGYAKSIRVNEEKLRRVMLEKAMMDFFLQTEKGQAILNAASVEDLRKL